MKLLILLTITISFQSYANKSKIKSIVEKVSEKITKKSQLKKYAKELDFETKSNGKCKYNRNQLNKAQMNNIYHTELNSIVKDTSPDNIRKHFNCIFVKRNLKRDSNKIDISPNEVFSNKKNG